MSDYIVKLAKSPEEVKTAQRLRFEVFNLEMKKGLASSFETGLDRDEYDELCDHILIIDKKSEKTIGTYRLLLRSRLKDADRFYSENEFDLTNIKKLKGEILEMGRSCVHKDYRRNSIVHLLWAGIVDYINQRDVHYIIGCPSIYSTDVSEISRIYTLMKKNYFAPEYARVFPGEKGIIPGLNIEADIAGHEKKILLTLPSLVRSYLKTGAYVCGEPVVDREFGTVDFFMLLDLARVSDDYLKRRFSIHREPSL